MYVRRSARVRVGPRHGEESRMSAVPRVLLAVGSGFWTGPRIAGALMIGAVIVLLVVSLPFYVRGDPRAVEAQFRPIDAAVGNTPVLRVASVGTGFFTLSLLAGFTVLAVDLVERGAMLLPVLGVVGLGVFTAAWVMESAFHAGLTVWAVRRLETGEPVPEIFAALKEWLNVWVQLLVNPVAFLALIGFAVAAMNLEVIPTWAGWATIVWSAVWTFLPFPLALYPAFVFFGAVLLVSG
jgi:hypothetical protein